MLELLKRQGRRIVELEEQLALRKPENRTRAQVFVLLEKSWGNVTYNPLDASVGAKKIGFITLTPKENQILKLLFNNKGFVFYSHLIEEIITGDSYSITADDLIRVQIKNLRGKLRSILPALASKIETVPGYGYRWSEE
jgi:DNA-binding response OmpR family regulator